MTARTVRLSIFTPSIGRDTAGREHKALRDAIDAASVSGETTRILNSTGAVIAQISPAQEHGEGTI